MGLRQRCQGALGDVVHHVRAQACAGCADRGFADFAADRRVAEKIHAFGDYAQNFFGVYAPVEG